MDVKSFCLFFYHVKFFFFLNYGNGLLGWGSAVRPWNILLCWILKLRLRSQILFWWVFLYVWLVKLLSELPIASLGSVYSVFKYNVQ